MRLNYILIPLITILVAWLGARFTSRGVREWYPSLRKPSWTPPGAVIGAVWVVLYVLASTSAFIVWNLSFLSFTGVPVAITAVFLANAALNAFWSYAFFARRRMGAAIWVCLSLDATIVGLIQMLGPIDRMAAWLLVPYAAWVTFASYLNYRVWAMNTNVVK